jgi:hypothetical protein
MMNPSKSPSKASPKRKDPEKKPVLLSDSDSEDTLDRELAKGDRRKKRHK